MLSTAIVLLSLPAALIFYLHVNKVPMDGRAYVLLISLYLATDGFFLMGFTQFRLGLALMVSAIACADLLRSRRSVCRFPVYCAIVLAGYFSHPATVIFLAPTRVVSSAVRLRFRCTGSGLSRIGIRPAGR